MQSGETVVLIAALLSGEGSLGTLDKGLADGLRLGNRGQVFYTLTVGTARDEVRIPVSEAEVIGLEEHRSRFHVPNAAVPLDRLTLQMHLPASQVQPAAIATVVAEHHLDQGRYELAMTALERAALLLLGEPEAGSSTWQALSRQIDDDARPDVAALLALHDLAEQQLRKLEGTAREADQPSPDEALRLSRTPPGSMAMIPAGTYSIGVFRQNAEFYNQTPRHSRDLSAYWIDRLPVSLKTYLDYKPEQVLALGPPTFATGMTHAQAKAFCEWRRSRLPTEFEWEAALNTPGAIDAPILEWTDSWYQSYPGNTYREAEYGTTHRVIRGGTGASVETSTRRFMSADRKSSEVGFRCAYGKN